MGDILTPSDELSYDKQMEPIKGILKDRFTLTLIPWSIILPMLKYNLGTGQRISDPDFSRWSNLSVSPQISYVPQNVVLSSFKYKPLIIE